MKLFKNKLIIAGVIFFFFLIAGLLICTSLVGKMCGNEVYEQVKSPDGKLVAIIFLRDCGATTGYSTQISVVKINYKLKNTDCGNVFIAGDDFGGKSPVKLKWITNDSIQIETHPNATIFKKLSKYKTTKIEYIIKNRLQ